jgi:hypothetical protein
MSEQTQIQPDSIATEVSSLVTPFLTSLQQGKADEAWDGVLRDSPLRTQTGGVEESKKQAQAQLSSIGAILDFTLLASREVAPSLVLLKYLVRHEREALTWAFAFYTPKDAWILTGIRWFPSAAYWCRRLTPPAHPASDHLGELTAELQGSAPEIADRGDELEDHATTLAQQTRDVAEKLSEILEQAKSLIEGTMVPGLREVQQAIREMALALTRNDPPCQARVTPQVGVILRAEVRVEGTTWPHVEQVRSSEPQQWR